MTRATNASSPAELRCAGHICIFGLGHVFAADSCSLGKRGFGWLSCMPSSAHRMRTAGHLAQQSQHPRLGVPGVGPGPSGGSGPAYFMTQQQQQHNQQQQQQPRLGVPGTGPGPSGGSGSGYATLGYGLGSAVYPGPPLRQRAAAAGQQQRPLHFPGPAGEGLAYPPGAAGPMSMSNPYGQQVRLRTCHLWLCHWFNCIVQFRVDLVQL